MKAADPRNEARHRTAVVVQTAASPAGTVYAADWRERRALRRMTARGEAEPLIGYPNVWKVR